MVKRSNKKEGNITVKFITGSIIIVMAIIFFIILFWPTGTAYPLENACVASPGYLCSNMALSTNGTISLKFTLLQGYTIYNTQFACSVNTPPNFTTINNHSTINDGASVNITDLPCYNSSNIRLNNLKNGDGFNGYLWINYTKSSSNSTYNATRIATITATAK